MKNLYKVISILVISILFSATSFSTPINQFINSVSPPMNANSFVKSSDIVISFEQVMNGSTMTSANVKVFGYQTGLMTISLDFNSVANTLTINPVNEFKNGEKISITLTSGIKTISNQSISPFVFKFRAKALGGTGSFTRSSEIITTGNYINSGDLDNDGDIDLLLNDKIYKNNGAASFTFYSTLSILGFSLMADFDNDGDLDLIVTSNNINYFFQNNGIGNFVQIFSFQGGLDNFGDLNGNGFLDISYFSDINANEIFTLKNTSGIFSQDTTYNLSSIAVCNPNVNNFKKIFVEDINNDGNSDIVVCNSVSFGGILEYNYCENFILLNNIGGGRFNIQNNYYHVVSDILYFALYSGDPKLFDINNDGNVDILAPDKILMNSGNGIFQNFQNIGSFGSSMEADFNGDSNIDVIKYYSSISPLSFHFNDGNGNFSYNYSTDYTLYNSSYTSADFDNDGDIDVVISESNFNKVSILLNGDTPLPIELSSFTSSINLNSVKLNWTTSQEQNNSGFEIQRTDNSNEVQEVWKKVDFINGAGNSSTEKNYSFDDKNLASGKYKYRFKQIDFNGNFEYHELSNEVVIGIPSTTELLQNYPNPFNPVTNISYRLSENGFVTLRVFDNSGREVKTLVNEFKQAGYYTDIFNGSDLASGVYFYKLSFGDFVQTKKLSLVK
ncbi:MAG: FG-GAP-like repeat-containing protein [Ignavibacteria bacterium]